LFFPRAGPFAAVIWALVLENSEFRNRKEFLAEAIALAHAGVVLCSPMVQLRARDIRRQSAAEPAAGTDLIQQIVICGAEPICCSPARMSIQAARLRWSQLRCGSRFFQRNDKRFKAFVLMAGGLSDELDWNERSQEYRQNIGPEKFDAFTAKWGGSIQASCVHRAAQSFYVR